MSLAIITSREKTDLIFIDGVSAPIPLLHVITFYNNNGNYLIVCDCISLVNYQYYFIVISQIR
jgi:hypothetical protein